MRALILGPAHPGGSLPPYLDALTAALGRLGVTADRHGSAAIPYDTARDRFLLLDDVLACARALAKAVDPTGYDLVAVHHGNLEIDQLVPALWAGRPHPPLVHHLHTLEPTLLRDQVPDPAWRRAVHAAIGAAAGYVYFGRYARTHAHRHAAAARTAPGGVAWLPTTIPTGTTPAAHPALAAALHPPDARPVISLYGYAAPWKDAALLRAAAARMRVRARIVLAGDFWDDPAQAGIDLTAPTPARAGGAEFLLVPGYLGAADRAALVAASTAGVFPYRTHPSFQGSGAIADYLAHGVPVVATGIANMAELIGDAGHIVPLADPGALAAALDAVAAGGPTARKANRTAGARANRFTADAHAARCLRIYQQVLTHTTSGAAP